MTATVPDAIVAQMHAENTKDAGAWDVAGDAWEEAGYPKDASVCHEMARLTREGKRPVLHNYAITCDLATIASVWGSTQATERKP